MIGLDNFIDTKIPQDEGPNDTVMAISLSAVIGGVSAKAFQLRAWIQGREVLLLIDSGSSNSFIDEQLATTLVGVQAMAKPGRVRVADGGEMVCSTYIPHCAWYAQGHEFFTDLKVLPLGTYDAILGMGWLEEHSPMTVDWRARFIETITLAGPIRLNGHDAASVVCETINSIQLQSLCSNGAVSHIIHLCMIAPEESTAPVPDCIQKVVDDFADVFSEPKGLPLRRACDHKIPLIPRAQLVNIRPYRHKPEHKTEIEKQVEELLRSGVIQRSTSPFSSPVILVKKKDGTWRLCIDYRQLNALTVIAKFPVPVIEELLDELHGAAWFSKLDLRAGYHQIRLAPGEEYKTAFQTHQGHFEFRVVSFGLAGAPATFIGAVTTTLKPVNRVCVLSFFDDILVFSATLQEHVGRSSEAGAYSPPQTVGRPSSASVPSVSSRFPTWGMSSTQKASLPTPPKLQQSTTGQLRQTSKRFAASWGLQATIEGSSETLV
ncbi:uncharacterized protein LOC125551359 [Triticum urartu]|uniref:uncharacterized protein LOC125551315 n=1 Tax=Triticum urartu TaxID=4572 RepID=UPI00204313BC|nr:uncharacterized protein LOC125551315 [Triticum urartu]XP_048570519.1 uncharacterized protein LOC125551359 [Triticum urartu]